MKIIAITGTPGTGKTALARELSLFTHYELVDVASFIKKHRISKEYDKNRKTQVIDINKLNKALIRAVKAKITQKKGIKGIIIDSHLSHFLPSAFIDACIVTTCSLKVLRKRLALKGYNASKIRENLDSEIFDTCLSEAAEKHKILVVDTSKKSAKTSYKSSTDSGFALTTSL